MLQDMTALSETTSDLEEQLSDDDLVLPPESLTSASPEQDNATLKRHLLGPSVGKSGQDNVDQKKVAEIIYEVSKGSKYFNNESRKDEEQTRRIEKVLKRKAELDKMDLSKMERKADELIAKLEMERDLTQVIVHVDCDAFYASVEELDRPELKLVPMAVGSGVLTTCNYEARKYGCRSGMAGYIATKLCPKLVCVRPDFAKYTRKAKEIREVVVKYDPRYEAASCDEAYINITKYLEEHEMSPEDAVQQLRKDIFEHTKLTVSAGIAPNARIAKIASNKKKPNDQFRITNERSAVMAFMRDLPIRKVNGIGRVFERSFEAVGINTCGDIYKMRGYLEMLFGEKSYEFLISCYLGLGRTVVRPVSENIRKSIGTESTFREISGTLQLREKLKEVAENLEGDLVRHDLCGRVLSIKITQHTFAQAIRQKHLPRLIWKKEDLYEYAIPLLAKLEHDLKPLKLRLMGLRLTNLTSMKKDDNATKDFFKISNPQKKRKPLEDSGSGGNSAAEDGVWESWPDDEWTRPDSANGFEYSAESPDHVGQPSNSDSPRKVKDMKSIQIAVEEEIEDKWSCPICSRDQPANDKQFNEHVDYCLSRQTIKDVVSEAGKNDDGKDKLKMGGSESPFKKMEGGGEKPVVRTFDMMLMGMKQQQSSPLHKGKKRRTR